eukprot:6464264-Amphidinium_carterae.1
MLFQRAKGVLTGSHRHSVYHKPLQTTIIYYGIYIVGLSNKADSVHLHLERGPSRLQATEAEYFNYRAGSLDTLTKRS